MQNGVRAFALHHYDPFIQPPLYSGGQIGYTEEDLGDLTVPDRPQAE